MWLPCDRSLDEGARLQAQRGLAARFSADKGSISGEHLGRLAGFKNWKRAGCWVNRLCRMDGARRFPVQPMEAPPAPSRCLTAPPPAWGQRRSRGRQRLSAEVGLGLPPA